MIVIPRSSEHHDNVSLWQSIFKRFDNSAERRTAYLDLMILAGKRKGELRYSDLDQIAFLIQNERELRELSWEAVETRVTDLSETELTLEQRLSDMLTLFTKPEHKTIGLKLVTSMLVDSERDAYIDFLDRVADKLQVSKEDRAALLTPWSNVNSGTNSFNRCGFNNPETMRRESVFAAMAHAENEVELALLTHKLGATRNALGYLGEDYQISAIGETIELTSGPLRIDAFLSSDTNNCLCRFVGNNETLFPGEFQLFSELLENIDANAQILIGHTKNFSKRDAARLVAIDDERIRLEFISD